MLSKQVRIIVVCWASVLDSLFYVSCCLVRGWLLPPHWVISVEVEPFQKAGELRGFVCLFVCLFPNTNVHLCTFHVNVTRENVTRQKERYITFG